MERIKLTNGVITAEIAVRGAELQSLRDAHGREWLWQGDPAFWNRHAPILFPLVGRAPGDHIRYKDRAYPIGQHGFARDRDFEVLSSGPERAGFRLLADPETRRAYPFDFELDIRFELAGPALLQTVTVRNPGAVTLPASIGFHPGFQWPLPGSTGGATDHVILFEAEEPAEIRRLIAGGVDPVGRPTPVVGRSLALDPELFREDAIIFDKIRSRSVWLGVPGRDGLRVDFPDLPYLGIWTKPGAPFLCIEPWQGHAAPAGFQGEIGDIPGMMHIAPGGSAARHLSLRLGAP